jgi:hypothetical protein
VGQGGRARRVMAAAQHEQWLLPVRQKGLRERLQTGLHRIGGLRRARGGGRWIASPPQQRACITLVQVWVSLLGRAGGRAGCEAEVAPWWHSGRVSRNKRLCSE